MADNITFHQYNNLHDIEDFWRSLDQQAERLSLGYIHYTYYQTTRTTPAMSTRSTLPSPWVCPTSLTTS